MISTTKSVTLHFYNEEYLLPWWLEHHRKIFDYGVMINYASTDRSVDIIKELCPHWKVIDSRNKDFGVTGLDAELMDVEAQFTGWRCSLSATEFLVGNYDLLDNAPEKKQYKIPTITFMDWDPIGHFKSGVPLWKQKSKVITHKVQPFFRTPRSIHNYELKYPIGGRHFLEYTTEDLAIFHFGNCISSPEMLRRRLQIQYRIPETDKANNWGHNHFGWFSPDKFLNEERLISYYLENKHLMEDGAELINQLTK